MTFSKKNILTAFCIAGAVIFLVIWWQLYIPLYSSPPSESVYVVLKGSGVRDISQDLAKKGLIKNSWFFQWYVIVSGNRNKLQAGSYQLDPSMPAVDIVTKLATGDVIKNTVTLIEGWDLDDMGMYFQAKNIFTAKDFLNVAKQDASPQFGFLADKPKKAGLEGYIFPDTYNLPLNAKPESLIALALANFDKKLTPDLRKEIAVQKKSLFQIITMASILEKEVKTPQDKKTVAGILWKRIKAGVPLQVDATINYVTGNSDSRTTKKDITLNSPYNTYKYYGLPPGPICNPGMDAILAAIYPVDSPYWYYLSVPITGQTIFSKTLDDHNQAVKKYLQ